MKPARHGTALSVQRLLALFAAGLLLFNFPLLKLWLNDSTVLGLPLLPVALFGAWALLLAVLAWLMERSEKSQKSEGPEKSESPEKPSAEG